MKSDQPDGALGRGLRMGKLAFRLTGSYLGYQIQNRFQKGDQEKLKALFAQKATRQIREELQDLKGPVMKLGQLLGSQGAILSQEAMDELSSLQMQAPAMHATLARTQFKGAVGKNPEEVFAEFEREPFAAASLGQVHRAVDEEGRELAVKIQYPGIRTAVKNDFKLLRMAAVGDYLPTDVLDELESHITGETDYLLEAENIARFREGLASLDFVDVPEVFPEWSSDRVLVMSRLEGKHLDEWLADDPTQEERDELGSRLFELFHFQLLVMEALHADPHPGNYLFTADRRVGMVDFGCVKEVDPQVVEMFRLLVESGLVRSEELTAAIAKLLWREGDPEEQEGAESVIDAWFDFEQRIVPPDLPVGAAVDFGDATLFDDLMTAVRAVMESKMARPELLFVKRAEIGLYNLLHRLGARVRTREIFETVVERAGF